MRTWSRAIKPAIVLALCCFLFTVNNGLAESEPLLSRVVAEVLKNGSDGKMNAGFASLLGLSKDQSPVLLKRVTAETQSTTNTLSVSLADKKSVVISVRHAHLGTFYLTDTSGKLIRVIVNDGRIKDGGLTNIPIAEAQKAFEKERDWWVKRYSR